MTETPESPPPQTNPAFVTLTLPRIPAYDVRWGEGQMPGYEDGAPVEALFARRNNPSLDEQIGYLYHLSEGIVWVLHVAIGAWKVERMGVMPTLSGARNHLLEAAMPFLYEPVN